MATPGVEDWEQLSGYVRLGTYTPYCKHLVSMVLHVSHIGGQKPMHDHSKCVIISEQFARNVSDFLSASSEELLSDMFMSTCGAMEFYCMGSGPWGSNHPTTAQTMFGDNDGADHCKNKFRFIVGF